MVLARLSACLVLQIPLAGTPAAPQNMPRMQGMASKTDKKEIPCNGLDRRLGNNTGLKAHRGEMSRMTTESARGGMGQEDRTQTFDTKKISAAKAAT